MIDGNETLTAKLSKTVQGCFKVLTMICEGVRKGLRFAARKRSIQLKPHRRLFSRNASTTTEDLASSRGNGSHSVLALIVATLQRLSATHLEKRPRSTKGRKGGSVDRRLRCVCLGNPPGRHPFDGRFSRNGTLCPCRCVDTVFAFGVETTQFRGSSRNKGPPRPFGRTRNGARVLLQAPDRRHT